MRNIVVAGEIYSPNLGDGVIYDCVRYLFGQHGVSVVPLDLAGRSTWGGVGETRGVLEPVSVMRQLARIPVRKSRTLRRGISASQWYVKQRALRSEEWDDMISSSDGVVIGGGQLLSDLNFGFPPKISEVVRLARRHHKPVAFFGCGAGSRWGFAARHLYSEALNYASFVSVRDRASAQLVGSVLASGKSVVSHPDPVFVANEVYPEYAGAAPRWDLGISMQPIQHIRSFVPGLAKLDESTYFSFWASLADQAVKDGLSVGFFSNGDPVDHAQAEMVSDMAELSGNAVDLLARPFIPADLVRSIRMFSSLVCTRMHAGITGFAVGRKVFPISWDSKVNNVWGLVGYGDSVIAPEIFARTCDWSQLKDNYGMLAGDLEMTSIRDSLMSATRDCIRSLGIDSWGV